MSIRIADNGVGFDMNAYNKKTGVEKGSGIGNLFRRAHLLDAKVEIKSAPDSGTQIQLEVPY
jgi:signal transduction histidine kinase